MVIQMCFVAEWQPRAGVDGSTQNSEGCRVRSPVSAHCW